MTPIRTSALTKDFGDLRAVDHINMDLPPTIRAAAENEIDTNRLIELATNAGYQSTRVNGAIEIDAPSVWAPDLNRLAWQAGITLKELQAASADLERAVFDMTSNNKTGTE